MASQVCFIQPCCIWKCLSAPHCRSVRPMCLPIRGFYTLHIPSPSTRLLAWWHEEKKGWGEITVRGMVRFAWCMCRQVFSSQRTPASLFDCGAVARMLMPPIWSTHLSTQACRLYILYGLDFLPALPVGPEGLDSSLDSIIINLLCVRFLWVHKC